MFDPSAKLALNDLANPMNIDPGPVVELLGQPLRSSRTRRRFSGFWYGEREDAYV